MPDVVAAGDRDARDDAHQGGARGVYEGGRRGEQSLKEYRMIKSFERMATESLTTMNL